MSGLILPGDPLFDWTLQTTPPPNWRETAARDGASFHFVVEPGTGLMRPATTAELEDYLDGGEYDDRLDEIGEEDEWDG